MKIQSPKSNLLHQLIVLAMFLYVAQVQSQVFTSSNLPIVIINTDIDPNTNTVVLGNLDELHRNGMWVRNINLIKYPTLGDGMDTITKIRSHHAGAPAYIHPDGDLVKVEFMIPVDAITPGQSAVFYEGNDVIGGGHIVSSFIVEAANTQQLSAINH